ncbi:Hypothetical protein A7982_05352 [Minicystis rosea]|nr:Hypothetical protein A7982_05352 [Minicystis rosea]
MTSRVAPVIDLDRSVVTLGGRRLAFHCHHYNVFLQRTIEDGLGARAPALLTQAAMETARGVLAGLEPGASAAEVIARGAALLGDHGFGRVDVTGLGAWGGEAVMERSHYAVGWLSKWGRRPTPGCFFPAGFLAGVVAIAGGHTPERVAVKETACLAAGAERCSFLVEVW